MYSTNRSDKSTYASVVVIITNYDKVRQQEQYCKVFQGVKQAGRAELFKSSDIPSLKIDIERSKRLGLELALSQL